MEYLAQYNTSNAIRKILSNRISRYICNIPTCASSKAISHVRKITRTYIYVASQTCIARYSLDIIDRKLW